MASPDEPSDYVPSDGGGGQSRRRPDLSPSESRGRGVARSRAGAEPGANDARAPTADRPHPRHLTSQRRLALSPSPVPVSPGQLARRPPPNAHLVRHRQPAGGDRRGYRLEKRPHDSTRVSPARPRSFSSHTRRRGDSSSPPVSSYDRSHRRQPSVEPSLSPWSRPQSTHSRDCSPRPASRGLQSAGHPQIRPRSPRQLTRRKRRSPSSYSHASSDSARSTRAWQEQSSYRATRQDDPSTGHWLERRSSRRHSPSPSARPAHPEGGSVGGKYRREGLNTAPHAEASTFSLLPKTSRSPAGGSRFDSQGGSLNRPAVRHFTHQNLDSEYLARRNDHGTKMYHRGYDHRYSYPPGRDYSYSQYGSQSGPPPRGYPPHPPHPGSSRPGVPYYQPQPARSYGGGPSYPPRDNFAGGRGGPAGRGGRIGQYTNLSWTPSDGRRGGSVITANDAEPKDDSQIPPPPPPPLKEPPAHSPDDEDNPFRPPADLRAEDESVAKRRKSSVPSSTATAAPKPDAAKVEAVMADAKNKISFSIKGRAAQQAAEKAAAAQLAASKGTTSPIATKRLPVSESPLERNQLPKSKNYEGNKKIEPASRQTSPPRVRKETLRKKRIKARPTLEEDHAQSDSVYFRKLGNESVVGSGTYGKVYKAIHVYTGRKVALKKIRMEGERDGFPVTAIREIKLLQSLTHVNVVALQEVMVEKNDCFMVFEYLAHDLTGLLNHPNFTLNAAHKKYLAKQLFEGLDYLHKRGVLHRDIKAANILVSKTGELRLADFGLARFYQKHQKQDYTNRVITIWYRPPELLLGETQYGPAVDVWSAACVLVEIFTRHAIFPGDGSEINQLDKIYQVLGTPSRSEWPGITELQWYELLRPTQRTPSSFAEKYKERVSEEAFELLQTMFLYDPNSRPTAADVLEHSYFLTEEPEPQQIWELEKLDGDWHEFESKALRKEKERAERDARRKERDAQENKRKAEEVVTGASEAKRPKVGDTVP